MSICGCTQEKLDLHPQWINNDTQRCMVIKPDQTVCGFLYSQHPSVITAPPTGKFISSRCIVILLWYNLLITIYLLPIFHDIIIYNLFLLINAVISYYF